MKKISFLLVAMLVILTLSAWSGVEKDLFQNQEDYALGDNSRNPGRIRALALGDVNGDGFGDVILGAPRAVAEGQADTGVVYIRFGLNFGPESGYIDESWFDLSTSTSQTLDPTISAVNYPDGYGRLGGVQINGEMTKGRFGSSLASGDFDGDGIDDIAIGMAENLEPVGTGRVYVIRGRTDIEGLIELDEERSNYRSFYITGREEGDQFGEVLEFIDINNDGREDLVMGTPSGGEGGLVDIFYGRDFPSFFSQGVDSLPDPHSIIGSEGENDAFGSSFASGDFTGDGLVDMAVGAPEHSGTASFAGKTYLFEGTPSEFIPFPRGTLDLAVTTMTLKISSSVLLEQSGKSLACGDFNGDGLDDLAIGAPSWAQSDQTNQGKVYLFYNDGERFQISNGFLPLSQADISFASLFSNQRFGTRIAFMDFDNYSSDDLVITSPYSSPDGRTSAGEAWIVFGRSLDQAYTDPIYYMQWESNLGVYIQGQYSGDFFGSELEAGNFNGDLSEDVFFTGNAGINLDGKSAWGLFGSPSYQRLAAGQSWNLYE